VYSASIIALGKFGSHARESIPLLTAIVKDRSSQFRAKALDSLIHIATDGKDKEALVEFLKPLAANDPNQQIRRAAADALKTIK
jgi:HEAT repeat protein